MTYLSDFDDIGEDNNSLFESFFFYHGLSYPIGDIIETIYHLDNVGALMLEFGFVPCLIEQFRGLYIYFYM